MRSVELQAEIRSGSGKEKARALRKSGKCPAVLYGPKRETVSMAFDSREFFLKMFLHSRLKHAGAPLPEGDR